MSDKKYSLVEFKDGQYGVIRLVDRRFLDIAVFEYDGTINFTIEDEGTVYQPHRVYCRSIAESALSELLEWNTQDYKIIN